MALNLIHKTIESAHAYTIIHTNTHYYGLKNDYGLQTTTLDFYHGQKRL